MLLENFIFSYNFKVNFIFVSILSNTLKPLFLYLYILNLKKKRIIIMMYFILLYYNNQYFIPKGLLNSYSYIHPILVLFFSYFYFKYVYTKNNIFFLLILITMFMGGYWALQEYNWGGWWNWDMIELPASMVLILYVYNVHLYLFKIVCKKSFKSIYHNFLISIYVFNKLFVNNSIHSFSKENTLVVLFIYVFIIDKKPLIMFLINLLNIKCFFFFKKVTILSTVYFSIRFRSVYLRFVVFFKRFKVNLNHIIYIYAYVCLVMFNFKNKYIPISFIVSLFNFNDCYSESFFLENKSKIFILFYESFFVTSVLKKKVFLNFYVLFSGKSIFL